MWSTAVCSASAVTALQTAAQLEVTFVWVLRDEHLSNDRPACPLFRLACWCWLRLLDTAAILLAATPKLKSCWLKTSTGWRRWWARPPNALASRRPPRAPSPPSPTSSTSFSLRLIDCLCSFSTVVHACSTASCLLAEIDVDCSYVLAVKASPTDVEMARLVALSYGSESASVPGFLSDGTGTFHRLFSVVRP